MIKYDSLIMNISKMIDRIAQFFEEAVALNISFKLIIQCVFLLSSLSESFTFFQIILTIH